MSTANSIAQLFDLALVVIAIIGIGSLIARAKSKSAKPRCQLNCCNQPATSTVMFVSGPIRVCRLHVDIVSTWPGAKPCDSRHAPVLDPASDLGQWNDELKQ